MCSLSLTGPGLTAEPWLTGTRAGAAMRRGSSGSGKVRCGAGQGSVARGLAGKTGHGWWRQCRALGMDGH